MATTHASPRRGEIEYSYLTAVIFNQIRSGATDFKRIALMPWMQEARTSPSDRQRISLVDMTLNQMMKDDIICQTPPTAPGGSKKYAISPRCKGGESRRLESYTTIPSQNTGYQWAKIIFKTKEPTQAMMATLNDLEFYLQERKEEQSLDNITSPLVAGKVMSPTFRIKGTAPNGTNDPTERPGGHRHRALSVGSDTTNGSEPGESTPLPPPNSRPFSGSPAYKSANPAQLSRRLDIGPKRPTGNAISPPDLSMTSGIAGLKGPTAVAPPPSSNVAETHATIDSSQTPPIPTFVSSGLALLHEKYPDDDFNPTLEDTPPDLSRTNKKIWLIKCHDCQGAIYRPSYTNNNFNVGNFETHLKNMKHTEKVMTKLAQLGREPKITRDVKVRLDRYSGGRFSSPQSASKAQFASEPSIQFPSVPKERQSSSTTSVAPVGRSRSVTLDIEPSLMVTLGPCEGLKKRRLETTPQLSENGDRKRPRLNSDDAPLAMSQKRNAEAYARIDALEVMSQSIRESFQKRADQLDARFQSLANFHKTLVDSSESSKQKILELDKLAHASTSVSRMHDGEIEDIKKVISAMSRSSQGDKLQVEKVVSKPMEMEQTIKDLQELCATQSQRLDAAAVVEKELNERIKMVQKLALRQADAMKAASKEKEETERRFTRLEAMIAQQSTETADNGWNEAFRTVIDRNSGSILQCQGETEHIMERVQVLERDREEKNAIITDLEAQIFPKKGAET